MSVTTEVVAVNEAFIIPFEIYLYALLAYTMVKG